MRVKLRVAAAPVIDAYRRLDIPSGGPPRLVPRLRVATDQVGRELVHEQQRREPRQKRDSIVERVDMVEHARGRQLHPRAPPQERPRPPETRSADSGRRRAPRVDAHDLIAAPDEVGNEPSLISAAHLEHARGGGGK